MQQRETNKIFLIAEIGQAHEGSLGIAHSYIDALGKTGVDAVKFQTHIAKAESSVDEPFRIKFSYEDKSRYDYWARMEFTRDQWVGLKQHCEHLGMEFISSPFSIAAVDLLESIGVRRYKVGSGEINNFLLLQKIADTGKPVILSSGMSSFSELSASVEFLRKSGTDVTVLQCTTAYPTQPEQWGLNIIQELQTQLNVSVGFSDHSGDIYAGLAASALGAKIIEFHVVFDKRMFGPDSVASLTIDQTTALVMGVREIERALNSPMIKSDDTQFNELRRIFGKSLAINKSLKQGHLIRIEDLECKKPAGCGIHAANYVDVIGKRLKADMEEFSFLNYDDLE